MSRVLSLAEQRDLARFESFYSESFGLIRGMSHTPIDNNDARIFVRHCSLANFRAFYGVNTYGAGSSIGRLSANFSAMGESIERYSGSIFRPERSAYHCSHRELIEKGLQAPELESLKLFSDEQFAHPAFQLQSIQADTRLRWIEGRDLLSKEKVYVPAEFAFVNDRIGDRINKTTTNGLGCGRSDAQALLSALGEVVERDSFMVAWWLKKRLPEVDLSTIKIPGQQDFVDHIRERYRGMIRILDMTSDLGIPSYLGVIVGRNELGEPSLTLSASCNLDPKAALFRALVETAFVFANRKTTYRSWIGMKVAPDYDESIQDFKDTILLYSLDSSLPMAATLLDASEKIPFDCAQKIPDEPEAQVEEFASRLRSRGYQAIGVDVTTDDVRSVGLRVYRAVVPGLVPINARHLYRYWGVPRLYRLGSEIKPDFGYSDLNPLPHPFP